MKYRISIWFVITCSILASFPGCVYGPKTEKKTPLNYLNGENYDNAPGSGPSTILIPTIKRKERVTHVRGAVVVRHGISELPLKMQKLVLERPTGEVVATGTSDPSGQFDLFGEIKNGRYRLRLDSTSYQASEDIEIDDYQKKIILSAKPLEVRHD